MTSSSSPEAPSPAPVEAWLANDLADLAEKSLLREPPARASAVRLARNYCSNDYLGYASEGVGAIEGRAGAGASRLVFGEVAMHLEAERVLSELVGAPASLLFASGYAANVGALAALARAGDLVVSDALNHASLVDGCRLSRATVRVVPHVDLAAIEEALASSSASRRWVVVESYYSMDGDGPDLAALRALCDRHGAGLVVDEAHALGVWGPEGRGRLADAGVRADVVIGTLGKSVGLQGAFVAGSALLRTYLWNRARSFVFSTGVSPLLASLVPDRVARLRADEAGRRRLWQRSAALREGLERLGRPAAASMGPIVPWLVGDAHEALRLAAELRARGFLVQAIRPPTVPAGSSRLRLTVTARHEERDLAELLEALAQVLDHPAPRP